MLALSDRPVQVLQYRALAVADGHVVESDDFLRRVLGYG